MYWCIRSKEESDKHDFTITKENYPLYFLFEQLFFDIENVNIDYYTEEEKTECKERNESNYSELFDKENGIITWYSDEVAKEVSNYLRIRKVDETFVLEFRTQPHIKGYDRDFNTPKNIPIRFRTSGSKYEPFNEIFVKMYRSLKQVDDVNDFGHQIHIEEYLYNKKVKKLVKQNGEK